jgi:hypothetical protein
MTHTVKKRRVNFQVWGILQVTDCCCAIGAAENPAAGVPIKFFFVGLLNLLALTPMYLAASRARKPVARQTGKQSGNSKFS